ncbi:hypothetical protein TvY486_0027010 [Trypanosoma vivax Y486]|uniref:Uncharacterized protein n=1 Tax=Trypanosoma vivax (strain Y486) TaxID=1055687 RepID=F9WQW7_TRYVY|nr:hypothetical protein TvY486_0027010 [Trypanosoma vivax Y486]|eukprot:CCD19949.1 hypothetical protein TvY486_0027010 [Trypanosoma vivax Y486]
MRTKKEHQGRHTHETQNRHGGRTTETRQSGARRAKQFQTPRREHLHGTTARASKHTSRHNNSARKTRTLKGTHRAHNTPSRHRTEMIQQEHNTAAHIQQGSQNTAQRVQHPPTAQTRNAPSPHPTPKAHAQETAHSTGKQEKHRHKKRNTNDKQKNMQARDAPRQTRHAVKTPAATTQTKRK